ncbi:Na+/H+ antiporter subunit E [Blastococcus sp. SYSU DS1024]
MSRPARRTVRLLSFLAWYAVRFVQANVRVAREILTPGSDLAPAVVEVPVHDHGRLELASLMSLVTLSPGTMAVGLTADRRALLVHGMHAADPGAFRAELLELDRRLLAVSRPLPPPPAPPSDSSRR